ncbi:cytochrome P450 [Apodospora peruviana]|uniref:Cytochrome P450 n=1 Tax=Apodospora peruviana TaxID=516989 RepID=A0AAE0M8Y5_9PEZI|nr:cytochrome P450 [Apodospora peruviana]
METIQLPQTASQWLATITALFLTWAAVTILYRRNLHALHNVPGPFLPSVTWLYGYWFNVLGHTGQYFKQIEAMHAVYGPVVRITPNEVHSADPSDYDKIYSTTSLFKDPAFYGVISIPGSIFTTIPNDLHRKRRAVLNPFFSKKAVVERAEDVVQAKIDKLCRRIRDNVNHDNVPTDVFLGYRAISIDAVTEVAFDDCWNLLDDPETGGWFEAMIRQTVGPRFFTLNMFPMLEKPSKAIPMWLAKRMLSMQAGFAQMRERTERAVQEVQRKVEMRIVPERPTLFHKMLDPDAFEGHVVPSVDNVVDEAFIISAAASDTLGNALTVATAHVLSHDEIEARLRKELGDRYPDPTTRMRFTELEKLPYLTAVIKEGLRLAYGVIGRLPRRVGKGGLSLQGHFLPEGTTASMSTWMMHRNPDAFPNPDQFDPARWLDPDPEVVRARDKCLVPFSRGQRMCVGIHLAYCMLYLTLANMFRRFDNLKPYNFGVGDLMFNDGFAASMPEKPRFKVVAASGKTG